MSLNKKHQHNGRVNDSELYPDDILKDYEKEYSELLEELSKENEAKQLEIDNLVSKLKNKGLEINMLVNLIASPILYSVTL